MNNIEENLFDAIYTMFGVYVSQSDFSRSVDGIITDVPSLAGQPYLASINGTSMNVYALDQSIKYKIDDEVYILALNNGLSSTKVILGKKPPSNVLQLAVENVASNYVQVSEDYVIDDSEYKLIANNIYEESVLVYSKELDGSYLNNFTRMNIKGDFRTAFLGTNIKEGEYGIRIDFLTKDYSLDYQSLYFKNNQMFHSYNSSNFYTTEQIVFNISEIKDIKKIKIYFYQVADSFKDEKGNIIPFQNSITGAKNAANLFVKNIHMSFGYDVSEIGDNTDALKLSSSTSLNYSSNNLKEKTVNLTWLHKFEDDTVKDVSETNLNYKIRWYKYTLFETYNTTTGETDGFLNKNWEYQEQWSQNSFIYKFTPRVNARTERIKAIVLYYNSENDDDWIKIETDEIVFENTNDVIPASAENTGAKLILSDNGYNGNYFVYGQDNFISSGVELSQGVNNSAEIKFSLYQNNNVDILTEEDKKNIKWSYDTNNSMLKNVSVEGNVFKYYIQNYYSANLNNNKISAELIKDGEKFFATTTLNFGPASLMGDSNITINFLDENTNKETKAILNGTKTLKFNIEIYNGFNEKQDISKYTIKYGLTSEKNSWVSKQESDENDYFSIPSQDFQITSKSPYFLWVSVQSNEDPTKNLIIQQDIPIKKSNDYNYITGSTKLLYSPSGVLTTALKPYELYDSNNQKIQDISWWIVDTTDKEMGGPKKDTLVLDETYYDNEQKEVVIAAKDIDKNILWLQPIARIKNLFNSPTINNWDGRSVSVGDASISTPMLAAGHKTDGKFTGVVIGDYDDTSANLQTGIYGFNNNEMVYSFKQDGTATIGVDGGGQIKIDGNQSVIQSSGYSDGYGMKIDFYGKNGESDKGPYIHAKSGKYEFLINADEKELSNWGGSKNPVPKAIQIGDKDKPSFIVDWAGNAKMTGEIVATSGTIGTGDNAIQICKDGYLFKAKNFSIDNDGIADVDELNVHASLAIGDKVAGWEIKDGFLLGKSKDIKDNEAGESGEGNTEKNENAEEPTGDGFLEATSVTVKLDAVNGTISATTLTSDGYYIGTSIFGANAKTYDYFSYKNNSGNDKYISKRAFAVDISTSNSASVYMGRHRNVRVSKGGNVYLYTLPKKWQYTYGSDNKAVAGGSLYVYNDLHVYGNIYCDGKKIN